MTTKRVGGSPIPVSEWQLRELPARVVTFLCTLSANAAIRAALAPGGFGPSEHREGWTLLTTAYAHPLGGTTPQEDIPSRAAAAALLEWRRTHFERLRIAFARLHPEAAALFSPAEIDDSASAVLAMSALLDWFDALGQDSPEFTTLEHRGLDRGQRQQLQSWLQVAREARTPSTMTPSAASPSEATPEGIPPNASTSLADPAVSALYEWYRDWSTTARTFIRRKDWLIRLGLLPRSTRRRHTD